MKYDIKDMKERLIELFNPKDWDDQQAIHEIREYTDEETIADFKDTFPDLLGDYILEAAAGDVDDQDILEQLSQLRTATWDGDIISKARRDLCVQIGYADKFEGWNFITNKGMQKLHELGQLEN